MTKLLSDVQILHELGAIDRYLLAAQDVVRTGHMPELTGLNDRVGTLCVAIQNAEPETQAECLPKLRHLIDQLNSCEAAMRKAHAVATNRETTNNGSPLKGDKE